LARVSSCQPGDIIYFQDDPTDYWYRLVDGAARKSAVMADGRRHIVSFLLPGDLFGFNSSRVHQFSVEVISPRTVVARYARRRAELLAESDPCVSRRVREAAFESISRLQARMILLGRNGALEKVAAFLLEMSERSADPAGVIQLPMTRYDIADYLSIAVETVSRSLSTMRSMRLIAFNGTRRIKVLDQVALRKVTAVAHEASTGACSCSSQT
jgi:CRP-like cAMP-binding protein